jgi:xylulokinase
MGAILNAGVCLNWFRNEVLSNSEMTFADIDNGIRQIKEQSSNIIFLPYLSGERTPHMDSNASGMLFGLTLNTNYWHMLKAIMEGVTFALKQSLDTCIGLGLVPKTIIASGGGARSYVWMQMMADIFNREIYTTNIKEHACVGAAIVAGVGCGIYSSIEEGCKIVVKLVEEPVVPIPKNQEVYNEYYQLYKELYNMNVPLFKKASEIRSRAII